MGEMTVGELKEALKECPEDAIIYMESSNAYIKGKQTTQFSQRAQYIYPCEAHHTGGKALMIVGSPR